MKIAIITDAWLPQVNGVVTAIDRVSRILESQEHEVVLIHPGQFKTVPMPLYPEIRLSLFPGREVARALAAAAPDAIHIATEGPLGWSARAYCIKKKIPFTTSYHTHFPQFVKARFGMFAGLTYTYMRRFHAPAATTMVATESLKKDLESNGFAHLSIWPLGVDVELFRHLPHKDEFPAPVFAYLGRVAVEKNIEEFLELDLPGTKLVIGDGPSRARLERQYGDSAKFVGYRKGEELAQMLASVDVLVFPSRTDTFGLVIVEALACGVPVAAHKVMGPRDIITHGVDGFLSEDLAYAALQCLHLSWEECRQKALQYSWGHSAEEFLSHLKRI